MKTGLPPVVGAQPRVLILGSLPGDQSIESGQYYANPRNHFWKIIAAVLDEQLPATYEERIAMMQRRGVALWDVLHCAERKGSLDSDIRNEQANDIPELLRKHPSIQLIVLNGGKAAKSFKKHFGSIYVPCVEVRSSSPVPSRNCNTPEEKLEQWKSARILLCPTISTD